MDTPTDELTAQAAAVVANPSLIDELEKDGRLPKEYAAALRALAKDGKLTEAAVFTAMNQAGQCLFHKAVKRAGKSLIDDPVGSSLARTLTFATPRRVQSTRPVPTRSEARPGRSRPRRRASSAASRDGPDGPEPPLAPAGRVCAYGPCNQSLEDERPNKLSCSESHKVLASRERAKAQAKAQRPSEVDPPIPVERLAPILVRGFGRDTGVEVAIEAIAHRSGVPFSLVRQVVRGTVDDVDFWTADRLLAAVGEVHAWSTELDDLYGTAA